MNSATIAIHTLYSELLTRQRLDTRNRGLYHILIRNLSQKINYNSTTNPIHVSSLMRENIKNYMNE